MSSAAFITSWPLGLGQGSGTAVFIRALRLAVEAAGTPVRLINPGLDARDYANFTLERFWFNVQLAHEPALAQARWVLGLDYDGFALPRSERQPFISSARAVFAELVETEPEPTRTWLRAQAYFEGHNLRRAHLTVTASEYARRKVIEHYSVAPERVRVIPNGIDLEEWDALWADAPEPEAGRRPTVLAVSKLYPRKRIGVLLRAAPLIRRRFPDVDVRIVGGGFEWDALQALTHELGLADSVTWLGDVDDRRRVVGEFKRCHVFVHPSIQEAFGNVILEGMASARPLVVADAAAPPELVRAADAGRVIAPDEPEALAEAVCALLADDAERERLGRNGRRFAETLTWARTAQQFLELVELLENERHNL